MNLSPVDEIMTRAVTEVCPAAQVAIIWRGQPVHHRAYGWLDPEGRTRPTQPTTGFDLASLTKLYTTTAFMALLQEGRIALDTPLSEVLPEFRGERPIRGYEDPLQPGDLVQVVAPTKAGVDAAIVTFRHLITHTAGLPAWRPIYLQPTRLEARQMVFESFFSYPPGKTVVYSDIGMILLGIAVEVLAELPLETVIAQRLCRPLGLAFTRYFPVGHSQVCSNIAPTEFCTWRQRRILGEVHDENAARLGGVSGHAGLFSTAWEVAAFGQLFLEKGGEVLEPDTVAQMTTLQAQDGDIRRGLGFLLWSPAPEAASHPLGRRAFGHNGFTGTSLWIDPDRQLVIALLTNRVYHGRNGEAIQRLRRTLHEAMAHLCDS
jgi:CubicO group peptidase (beta-lactamase class C family)